VVVCGTFFFFQTKTENYPQEEETIVERGGGGGGGLKIYKNEGDTRPYSRLVEKGKKC
jgi:hypothetical protein